jgi:hypothetical protein
VEIITRQLLIMLDVLWLPVLPAVIIRVVSS